MVLHRTIRSISWQITLLLMLIQLQSVGSMSQSRNMLLRQSQARTVATELHATEVSSIYSGAASSHVPLGQSVQVLSGSGGAAGENMEILKPGEKLLRSESTSETVSKALNSLGELEQVVPAGKFFGVEEEVEAAEAFVVKQQAIEPHVKAFHQDTVPASLADSPRTASGFAGSKLLIGLGFMCLLIGGTLAFFFLVPTDSDWGRMFSGGSSSAAQEDVNLDDLDEHGVVLHMATFLQKVDLFKRLKSTDIIRVVQSCTALTFEPGTEIVTQGDAGEDFYIIKKGTAKVMLNGNMVATLKSGAYFGENGLIRDSPRNATIVCQAELEALKLTRSEFNALGLKDKLNFAKRGAVGGGKADVAKVKPPVDKSDEETNRITQALRNNLDLNSMLVLDESELQAMIAVMWKDNVPAGTALVKEGDLNADYFYVVNSGEFDVSKYSFGRQAKSNYGTKPTQSVAKCEVGSSFGELSLLYFAPRAATVTAAVDSTVFVIASQQFKAIIHESQTGVASTYVKHLDKVAILDPLKDSEKKQLAEALTDFVFTKDENIFEAGEKGVLFYILIEGEVSVIKSGKEVQKLKATKDSAQFFGEGALINNENRAATIKVVSPTAVTLAVDKTTFDMLLGPLEQLKKRGKENDASVEKLQPVGAAKIDKTRFGKIKYKDLTVKGLLGCGGFGTVRLVEHAVGGNNYALKGLSKGYVLQTRMEKDVMNEKNMQLMCDSPFIIKLFETYNSEQELFLLLELAPGGELFATYNKKGLWGSEPCAKFYVAGTVFAFEHLHGMKVLFRDLKPENLLLNGDGRVKLTDMGLAKVCVGKTFTCCGTPDYFAPEVLSGRGHDAAVDWWALGILTFELLGGHPAFESDAPAQTYQKIRKGINKVKFPRSCQGPVENFIKACCHDKATERLPMKRGGTGNVKKHDWYKHFDWPAMESLKMDPPYKPAASSKKMANFDCDEEEIPPQVFYKDPHNGWDKDFATST